MHVKDASFSGNTGLVARQKETDIAENHLNKVMTLQ